jgi:small subunit ribosomal protein S1
MSDPNVNPSNDPAPEVPHDHAGSTGPEMDKAIDAALDAASAKSSPPPQIPLKRMWDSELEAELEAALSGFDPGSFEARAPRSKPSERAASPAGQRGQEGEPGPRTGKVIGVRGKSLFVDLGGKSEGFIPVDQLEGPLPEPGSVIEVVVDRFDPDEGLLVLRQKGSAIEATWQNLRRGVVVEARVTKSVKGGLEVDVDGIRGFLPISQIDLLRVDDAASYVNQKFKAKVTEANPRERNLVISRRDLLEEERAEQRERMWATLAEGQVHEGVVRSIKSFGAFIDLGGVDGLLPIGEMSWSRIAKVDDMLRIADRVKVKVLKLDKVARKLTLGLKQLAPNPWDSAPEKYPRGSMVKGKVSKIMDFGAFVELEPGIEGLIHITELSPNRVRRVADIVQAAQEVEVRVLKVEPEARRIALSLLPALRAVKAGGDETEGPDADASGEPPPAPRPERKVPLKGGLGDRERGNRGQ